MANTVTNAKSPYVRGNSSRRGRSWMLVVTVLILLAAVVAWTTVYTDAVATSPTAPATDVGTKQAAPDR